MSEGVIWLRMPKYRLAPETLSDRAILPDDRLTDCVLQRTRQTIRSGGPVEILMAHEAMARSWKELLAESSDETIRRGWKQARRLPLHPWQRVRRVDSDFSDSDKCSA